jgi:hypothetical protein
VLLRHTFDFRAADTWPEGRLQLDTVSLHSIVGEL